MSIFGKIKDAIFGKKDKPAEPADAKPVSKDGHVPPTVPGGMPSPTATTSNGGVMTDVDVEEQLAAMPGASALNWRTSVVDLLKLVGVDPSFENRKDLAQEMGDTDYSGKAEENIALHRSVMRALARNGGKVPASLTD